MGAISTSGLIILAAIDIAGNTYSWHIEAKYDGERYGGGAKAGMQNTTYSGNLSPSLFDANSTLIITEEETSVPVSKDFQRFLLKYGSQLIAQALNDLNVVMKQNSTYSVSDLGFTRFY